MNTCVAKANYSTFFITISSLLIMLGVVVSSAIVLIVERAIAGVGFDWKYVVLGLVVMVDVPFFLMDFTLVSFHVFLCCKGVSTYEYLTGKESRKTKLRREAAAAAKEARRGQRIAKKPTVEWGTIIEEPGNAVTSNVVFQGGRKYPSLPPVVTMPIGPVAQAEGVTGAHSSGSSSESEGEQPGGMATVADTLFSNFLADEEDPPLKQALSSVIFGSGMTSEGAAPDAPPIHGSQMSLHPPVFSTSTPLPSPHGSPGTTTSIFPGLASQRSPTATPLSSQGHMTVRSPPLGEHSIGSQATPVFGGSPLASTGHHTVLVHTS